MSFVPIMFDKEPWIAAYTVIGKAVSQFLGSIHHEVIERHETASRLQALLVYLDSHPEVRDEIEAKAKELRKGTTYEEIPYRAPMTDRERRRLIEEGAYDPS